MTDRRSFCLMALGLCLLATELRFYRLGDWPFHGDELATLEETRSLTTTPTGPLTSQVDRLPRLVPLSYGLHLVGQWCFGSDEFGSRVLPALLGSLHVLIVFLLLDRPLGRVTALATALVLALWPEHLYRSQENRFYMTATLFASLAMLAGAKAVQLRAPWWTVAACGAALAALLSHTLQGLLLLGGLFLAFAATAWISRDNRIGRLLGIILASSGMAALLFVVYLLPLVKGWNSGETWGYGVLHSVLASVSQLSWPVALLAGLGLLSLGKQGDLQVWYWSTWAVVWAAASVLLPLLVSYHPAYVFPLSLGVLVVAGRAIALIFEGLAQQNVPAALAWLGLAGLLNLPGVISYYADGSRYDFRTPAQHVSAHWQPGDHVCTFSPRLLAYYAAPGIEPVGVRVSNPLVDLRNLAQNAQRLWIVIPSNRAGKPEALDRWLTENCSLRLRQRQKRLDYYEHVTEVFLYEPAAGPRLARSSNSGGSEESSPGR